MKRYHYSCPHFPPLIVQALPLCEGIQVGFADMVLLLSSQSDLMENEPSCFCQMRSLDRLQPVIHDKTCPMRNRPGLTSCHVQECQDGKTDED